MRIMLVAGEISGDNLGSSLISSLKKIYPNATFEGIGGSQMIRAGLHSLYSMDILSVMGLVEVLKKLPKIVKLRKNILKHCKTSPPDIYIGIDAPDFNLPIELKLKKIGIKTIHYVSPSIWAWRIGRIKKIKKATDIVFSILPFEENFYKKNNHKAIFVGHPMANKIPLIENDYTIRSEFQINLDKKVIAVLPGSRAQEIIRMLPVFLKSLSQLRKKGYQFDILLPVADQNLHRQIYQYELLIKQLDIQIIDGNSGNVLQACDFALITSGTATLEAMLYKKPMVIGYKVNSLTAIIMKQLLTTKFVGLPNILAGESIVPELLQENFTSDNCCKCLQDFFENNTYISDIKSRFYQLHQLLLLNSDKKIRNEVTNLLNS